MALALPIVLRVKGIFNLLGAAQRPVLALKHYIPGSSKELNRIYGVDKKLDGGWEMMFMDLENISEQQRSEFSAWAKSIPNSSFTEEMKGGITRIGFY